MIDLDDEECFQLTIACCITGGLYAVNLLIVIHNVYRYLFKLKITKSLIVMFYVFVTINSIANIIEFIYKAKDP